MSTKGTIRITDKDRIEMNKLQEQLHQLQEEIEKARLARVEGMDTAAARCDDCLDRIAAFKAQYFPGKK